MHCIKRAIFVLSIGVGLAVVGQSATGKAAHANIGAGKEIFHQHCSLCHGVDAKGFRTQGSGTLYDPDSPEPGRRVPPADLTALSDRNAGVFPTDRVRQSVTNRGSIQAHGTPEMPAWGRAFDSLKSNPKRMEQQLRDLTAYIESMQERSNGGKP